MPPREKPNEKVINKITGKQFGCNARFGISEKRRLKSGITCQELLIDEPKVIYTLPSHQNPLKIGHNLMPKINASVGVGLGGKIYSHRVAETQGKTSLNLSKAQLKMADSAGGNPMQNQHKPSIYSSKPNYSAVFKGIEKEGISEANKELLKRYLQYLISKSVGADRCDKVLYHLRTLCRTHQKNMAQWIKQDIIEILVLVRSHEKWSDATKHDYLRAIKQYFRWYEDEDERMFANDQETRKLAAQLYRYLRETRGKYSGKKILPSDILLDEDIAQVLEHCHSFREQAYIRMLHETGARVGEILTIKIKHITFHSDGCGNLLLDGKTGERRIPFALSTPYLRQYLLSHPEKNNPEAFVWLNDPRSHQPGIFKYRGAVGMLHSIQKRIPNECPVKRKPFNHHFFRHSRATLLAPHLTEAMLCKFFGWALGSKQVRTYVHLCPEALDQEYYRVMGITNTETKTLPKTKPCTMCATLCEANSDFCPKCGKPFGTHVLLEEEFARQRQLEATVKRMLQENRDKFEDKFASVLK